ncbi:MAG: hypothetical protein PHQ00_00045 [Phycisphaerae bacterium]|nr:hypothetical protein [Phycisphaerae bacterium]
MIAAERKKNKDIILTFAVNCKEVSTYDPILKVSQIFFEDFKTYLIGKQKSGLEELPDLDFNIFISILRDRIQKVFVVDENIKVIGWQYRADFTITTAP